MQTFSPITEHVEIMNHIEKQLARSQQGCADDLPRVLWVHGTLLRNSQGRSPFTLTYSSEVIPPSTKSLTPIRKEYDSKDKRKEGEDMEVAFIEDANYQNKLQKYHDTRSSRC
ncbi:hypothetical protein Tco_0828657 [Tanacetum coccineum]